MGWEECSVRPTARRTPSCRPRCRSQIERRRCLKRAGDLARSCRWLWLAGGPSRRRDPRRKGLARRWCCARQVDAAGNLQVLGVLSGQHQPLYSGQPLGKAELCTVTSYVDTTMAPLIDSHRCCGPTSTRTSICPVIRQFWGSSYIDEHAWRLIPSNSHKNLQNVKTTESLGCLQYIVIWGPRMHPHATCLGKDRDRL